MIATVLQAAVTFALLYWFFRDPDFRREAAEAITTADPRWLLIGIAIAGIENLLGVLRWRIFLRMVGVDLPFWRTVQICLLALFCNTFLLGAAGGDLIRAACLLRYKVSKTAALLSVTLDRVAGLGGLILVTVGLVILEYDWLVSSPTVSAVVGAILVYQVVAAVIVGGTLVLAAKGWGSRLPSWAPFKELAAKLGAGYAQLAVQWPASIRAVGLTLLMLAGYFGVFFCAVRAFGAPLTYWQLSALMPAVDMISALPISVGGLGVREKVFVVLLGDLAAVPAALAVSISLAGYLMNCSWGLVGAGALPFFRGIVHDAKVSSRS